MTTLYRVPAPPGEIVEQYVDGTGATVRVYGDGSRTETSAGGHVTRYWFGTMRLPIDKYRPGSGYETVEVEYREVPNAFGGTDRYYRRMTGNPLYDAWVKIQSPPRAAMPGGAKSSPGGGGTPKPTGSGGGGGGSSGGGTCPAGQTWVEVGSSQSANALQYGSGRCM